MTSLLSAKQFIQILLLCISFIFIASPIHAQEVVVYSARIDVNQTMFDAFTTETGIKVKFTADKEGALLARLQAEGKRTPADVVSHLRCGNLWEAARAGLLKPVSSPILEANIPVQLRDPQGQWYGLSIRARTLVYNKEKVDPSELSTYEDLANPKWKGRLCCALPKVYNQSLVAMMIARHGEARPSKSFKGWKWQILATEPLSDDTKAMEYVAADAVTSR